jgi:transcriptional regulator with XRE-family HTH domain
MSKTTDSTRQQLIESLKDKIHRRAFSDGGVQTDIAIQIRVNRDRRKWTQVKLAAKMNKSQGAISKLEDPEKQGLTLDTLKELSAAFDVALLVRFVPYSELLNWLDTPSEDKFYAVEFEKDPGIFPPPESKPEAVPETKLADSWASHVAGLRGLTGVVYKMPASAQIAGATQIVLGRARLPLSEMVETVRMETPKDVQSKALKTNIA